MGLERKGLKRKQSLKRGGITNEGSSLVRKPMKQARDNIRASRKFLGFKKGSKGFNLVSQCDRFFSLYTRASKSNNTICRCYTCDKPMYWFGGKGLDRAELGHYFSRRNMCTRYSELCQVQCNHCNQHLGGNLKVFKEKLLLEFGQKRFKEEEEFSKELCRLTKEELKLILHKYKKLFFKECYSKGLDHALLPEKQDDE